MLFNNLIVLVKRLLSWDFYQKSVTVREFLVFHTVSQTNFSKKICEINRKFIMLQNALCDFDFEKILVERAT